MPECRCLGFCLLMFLILEPRCLRLGCDCSRLTPFGRIFNLFHLLLELIGHFTTGWLYLKLGRINHCTTSCKHAYTFEDVSLASFESHPSPGWLYFLRCYDSFCTLSEWATPIEACSCKRAILYSACVWLLLNGLDGGSSTHWQDL